MTLQRNFAAFEVAHKQNGPSLRYDIVIVHPFHAWNRKTQVFRDAFRGLRDNLITKVRESSNIYLFAFNGERIINGKISIEAVSRNLLRELVEQRATQHIGSHNVVQSRSDEPDDAESRDISSAREVRRDEHGHNGIAQPYLLFICHSLGSWVVKAVLSQNKYSSVSVFNTQGTILLDGPPSTSGSTESYLEYIQSLHQDVFNRHVGRPDNTGSISKDLPSMLSSIDQGYSDWVDSACIKEARRDDQIAEEILFDPYRVWMSKSTIPTSDQEPKHKKFPSLFRNLRRDSDMTLGHDADDSKDILLALINMKLDDLVNQYVKKPYFDEEELYLPMAVPGSSDGHINDNNQSHLFLTVGDWTPSSLSPAWYTKKEYDFLSSDMSHMTITSESDMVSVRSMPSKHIVQLGHGADKSDIHQNISMGIYFEQNGEFDNAESAFSKAYFTLRRLNTRESCDHKVEIRAHLAGIALFRGRYEEAHEEFKRLLSICERQPADGKLTVMRRWTGMSLLYNGKYELAGREFRRLLNHRVSQNPLDEEVQVRRDLALASAYSGNFHEAFDELKKAHELLAYQRKDRSSARSSVVKDETMQRGAQSIGLTEASDNPTITNEQNVSSSENARRVPTNAELDTQRDTLLFTQAKIGLLWGSVDLALEDSEQAIRGMKKRWGPSHIKTLECAGLNALLLALNSQTRAAEINCTETVRQMSIKLGHEHPLTLEAMGYLVRIYQMQSRFLEAVETARSLAQAVKSARGENHPQTLRYRFLCAESELKIGNFALSKTDLAEIVKISKEQLNDHHPEALDYQYLLALAYHHCAENDKAEKLSLEVLRRQLGTYLLRQYRQNTCDQKKVADDLNPQVAIMDRIASLDSLQSVIKALIDGGIVLAIRPPLLKTLWMISLVLQQKEDAESLALATKILEALQQRYVREAQADKQQDAINAKLDLALAIRREAQATVGDDINYVRLKDAAMHLRDVYRSRFLIWGAKHPQTLSAKLELIITNCMRGEWEELIELKPAGEYVQSSITVSEHYCSSPLNEETWRLVESESTKIPYLHEGQLGGNHPDTLKSFAWLFAIQILLGDTSSAFDTWEKVRVRFEQVRDERLVESLDQEYKLALVGAEASKEQAVIIWKHTEVTAPKYRSVLPKRTLILSDMVREVIGQDKDSGSGEDSICHK